MIFALILLHLPLDVVSCNIDSTDYYTFTQPLSDSRYCMGLLNTTNSFQGARTQSVDNCSSILPGLDHLRYGYQHSDFFPLLGEIPSRGHEPIFEFNCNPSDQTTYYDGYQIPDIIKFVINKDFSLWSIEVFQKQNLSEKLNSNAVRSKNQRVSLANFLPQMNFSFSSENHTAVIMSNSVSEYQIWMNGRVKPRCSVLRDYLNLLEDLPGNVEKYQSFIIKYGWYKYKYANMGGQFITLGSNPGKKPRESLKKMNIGGEKTSKVELWMKSLAGNSVPISGRLEDISSFIENGHQSARWKNFQTMLKFESLRNSIRKSIYMMDPFSELNKLGLYLQKHAKKEVLQLCPSNHMDDIVSSTVLNGDNMDLKKYHLTCIVNTTHHVFYLTKGVCANLNKVFHIPCNRMIGFDNACYMLYHEPHCNANNVTHRVNLTDEINTHFITARSFKICDD